MSNCDNFEDVQLHWLKRAMHASLEKFKNISEQCIGGPTKFTTWGDIDHMLQCTNHYRKDRSGNIDWSLEVEEGECHIIYSLHTS